MAWPSSSICRPGRYRLHEGLPAAVETVFGNAWRIAAASMIAFWCGSFANSYVLAKMKLATKGRLLWTQNDRLDGRR